MMIGSRVISITSNIIQTTTTIIQDNVFKQEKQQETIKQLQQRLLQENTK